MTYKWIHCIYNDGRQEYFGVESPVPNALRVGDGTGDDPTLFATDEENERGDKIYREAGATDGPGLPPPYPVDYTPEPQPCPECDKGRVHLIMWDYFGPRIPQSEEPKWGVHWEEGLRGIVECDGCGLRFHFFTNNRVVPFDTSLQIYPA
jgi:hypothetical protein